MLKNDSLPTHITWMIPKWLFSYEQGDPRCEGHWSRAEQSPLQGWSWLRWSSGDTFLSGKTRHWPDPQCKLFIIYICIPPSFEIHMLYKTAFLSLTFLTSKVDFFLFITFYCLLLIVGNKHVFDANIKWVVTEWTKCFCFPTYICTSECFPKTALTMQLRRWLWTNVCPQTEWGNPKWPSSVWLKPFWQNIFFFFIGKRNLVKTELDSWNNLPDFIIHL